MCLEVKVVKVQEKELMIGERSSFPVGNEDLNPAQTAGPQPQRSVMSHCTVLLHVCYSPPLAPPQPRIISSNWE